MIRMSSQISDTPKGCHKSAQGNALGTDRHVVGSPEEAGSFSAASRMSPLPGSQFVTPIPRALPWAGLLRPFGVLVIGVCLVLASSVRAEEKKVSYYKEVFPIFKRSCNGCHHPGKLKGELDLTTYTAFKKGGKHGAAFKAGAPKGSGVIDEISGEEPSMPKEG